MSTADGIMASQIVADAVVATSAVVVIHVKTSIVNLGSGLNVNCELANYY